MRSTLEIEIDVSEDSPVTEQELRYALFALGHMYSLVKGQFRALLDSVEGHHSNELLQLKARHSRDLLERMFQARKKSVDEWLGPENIPGSPEQQRRLRLGKTIVKRATGIDLDVDVAKPMRPVYAVMAGGGWGLAGPTRDLQEMLNWTPDDNVPQDRSDPFVIRRLDDGVDLYYWNARQKGWESCKE